MAATVHSSDFVDSDSRPKRLEEIACNHKHGKKQNRSLDVTILTSEPVLTMLGKKGEAILPRRRYEINL